MRQVVCFGEALIDFLHTGTRVQRDLSLNTFTQFPGGAPANTAVAVAKLGGISAFAGQVGDDPFGQFIIDALDLYQVDTSFVTVHPSAKTALAFVFLDDTGERSFSFHRHQTADVVLNESQIRPEWFSQSPIFHFCSNTLTDCAIAQVTRIAVNQAHGSGCLVSFDVNLRHNLWAAGAADINVVNELVAHADIVKFSAPEIDYLSHGDRQRYLATCFSNGVSNVLITDGAGEVHIHRKHEHRVIIPPQIEASDTTGGGDAFIGAILFGLSQLEDTRGLLNDLDSFTRLVEFATHCGAIAVSRQGAFPAFPTLDDVKDKMGALYGIIN